MVETQNTTMPPKLAKDFASFDPEDLKALKNAFGDLDQSAHEKAKFLLPAAAAFGAAWDDLLPVLSGMQSLLSQRGKDRGLFGEAGLPTWSEWFESFRSKSGLRDSLRTVQGRLQKYRDISKPANGEAPKRPSHPTQQTPRNQRRLLRAALCLMDMAAAVASGGDPSEALAEAQRIGLDAAEIERQLERSKEEAELDSPSRIAAASTPPTSMSAPSPIMPQELKPSVAPIPMPKAGDCIGLFDLVNDRCGAQIRATLAGLSPDLMANTFGKFVDRLALAHCRFDHEAGEIRVTVEYISAKQSQLETAA
jgi:hypothetical protein